MSNPFRQPRIEQFASDIEAGNNSDTVDWFHADSGVGFLAEKMEANMSDFLATMAGAKGKAAKARYIKTAGRMLAILMVEYAQKSREADTAAHQYELLVSAGFRPS